MIDITNVAPFRPRPKDPTAALQARRARRKRKAATSTTTPTTMPSVTVGATPEDIPTVTPSGTPPLVSLGFPGDEERHGGRHSGKSDSDNFDGDRGNPEVGRSLAIRNAAGDAASLVGPESGYAPGCSDRWTRPGVKQSSTSKPVPVPSSSKRFEGEIRPTSMSDVAARFWSVIGRTMIGLAIVSTGAWVQPASSIQRATYLPWPSDDDAPAGTPHRFYLALQSPLMLFFR